MYKLMIVDDEPLIVDWLFRLFSGLETLHLDTYRAYSGEEALHWLNRTKIDIVITDIHMPGMDGMQLLDQIKGRWPECKVIFLTGYNQFDYVYTAIKSDGVSYLLKTETDDEIVGAVKKAIADLERGFRDAERLEKAKQQVGKAIPLLQKEYITALLRCDPDLLPVTQRELDEAELPLRAELPVLALLGRMDNAAKRSDRPISKRQVYTVRSLVEDVLFERMHAAFLYEEPYFVWLFQQSDPVPDWAQAYLYIREMLETAQRACIESLEIGMSFALAREQSEWEAVGAKADRLKRLLTSRIGPNGGVLVTEGDAGSDAFAGEEEGELRPENNISVQLNRIEKLASALERGEREEFFDTFAEIEDYFNGVRHIRYAPAAEVFLSLSLRLISHINRWGLTETPQDGESLPDRLSRFDFERWAEAVADLRIVAERIFSLRTHQSEKRERDTILRVQQYIREHLSEDISLVKLGELTHFNPSYLSRLFKQATGINISDLIHQVRIDKAKELLEATNLKIQDVSAAVGFDSPAYFAKFFKKKTRMTPQEYRDSTTRM